MLLPLLLNGDGILGIGGTGGVAGRTRSDFGWEKWRRLQDAKARKKKQLAESKVVEIAKLIEENARELEKARDIDLIQKLLKELDRLERRLSKAREKLSDIEMEEVALLWALMR